MSIFEAFTGDAAKKAAEQQRALFDQTKTTGLGDIQQGQGASLANLGQGYGQARGAYTDAYGQATGGVNQGYAGASGALAGGGQNARDQYGLAMGNLQGAGAAYDPLSALGSKYGGATSTYLDSLGINGAEGNARASAAFTPSSAYSFNLDQGIDSINRRRAMSGGLAGGNADRDAQVYGAGLASNEMKGWQDRLAGFINPELAATSGAASGRAGALTGMAGINTAQAGMESTLGNNQAALSTGRGAMLADLSRIYGTQMGGAYSNEGTGMAGINTGAAGQRVNLGTGLAQPYANTYKQEADAELGTSKNVIGLGMAAAQMAMGMPPTSLASIGQPNPSSPAFGSNPFTPSGNVNPAYMKFG